MKIPFVDLTAQYISIKDEIDSAIHSVIDKTAFVRGEYVTRFEEEFALSFEVPHCVSCANGTDALYLALKALNIGPGDEVITTSVSWISTSQTISQVGANVVFVDIEPGYFTIDPSKIEEKITNRTRAIIPVHLYGQPAEMNSIMAIAKAYGLAVIEDCAQAHYAEYQGKRVGTIGDVGTFSFYPGKNLGAYGDAGGLITSNEELAKKARMIANHGSLEKHRHEIEGINSRLDGIQAAVLLVKLNYIHQWNAKRGQHAAAYDDHLADFDYIQTPLVRGGNNHVYHLYVVRTPKRDELQTHLNKAGISTGIHYPVALPFLKAYDRLGHHSEDFPVAYQYQSEILSLPMYPELSSTMISSTSKSIRDYFGKEY